MTLLSLHNIKKHYGELTAVDGISLEIQEGDLVGLLGPNGAGKSTTISMMATLLQPDSGDILYRGNSIVKNPAIIRQELGLVPQEIALYPSLTGRENLAFWGRVYGLKGKTLHQRMDQVSDIITIDEKLDQKVETYSGGMKRRLNIGAALLHQPKLLILDEPTVGIDPQSRNHILESVKKLNESGVTVIYTSHYMEEVEFLCRTIHIVDGGKKLASGSKAALLKKIDNQSRLVAACDNLTPQILEEIKGLPSLNSVTYQEDKLQMTTHHTTRLMGELIHLLGAHGMALSSLDVYQPNLETVFLELTGKALRD